MSVLQYPNSIDVKDVQIIRFGIMLLIMEIQKQLLLYLLFNFFLLNFNDFELVELDSNSSEENFSPPHLCRSHVSLNIVNRNSHGKPLKVLLKEGLLLHHHIGNDGNVCKIDAEMEEIETEIGWSSLKLESLRLLKRRR
ncbi:hypothetical protein FRX31_020430 [Thalictrum thalictroides]|uniref:Uncharacterized protein n=1 Tax=Thalictrum thalictroides TaxID=46969 RepID=A0A7J6W043_THATH|nr:hypothetical protein FRX31_020430 [Thalictrum thalictroides]